MFLLESLQKFKLANDCFILRANSTRWKLQAEDPGRLCEVRLLKDRLVGLADLKSL